MREQILKNFLTKKEILDSYRVRMINLISDLLRQESITIHFISGRTKDYDSLSKKIDRKLGKYTSMEEITDLVGLRIISYLESDVDRIATLIRREFDIDDKNSIDKREQNIDQFGYKSLHLVTSLNKSRKKLAEYRGYENLKCEIQIRSILQHAWAEIEHDLGYKGKASIPNQYKRNFNRLAALLETADVEFDRLKKDLTSYEADVVELIKTTPETVQIDQASLSQFNFENNIIKESRDLLTRLKGWKYTSELHGYHGILERFEFFKIYNIKDLELSLEENKKEFFKFLEIFTKDFTFEEISYTIVFYYYQHFLAAKSENVQVVSEYLDYPPIRINSEDGVAERFIETYQAAKAATNSGLT